MNCNNISNILGEIVFVLVPWCIRQGIVKDFYPLHCREELYDLSKIWVTALFSQQPLG